jgi:hypothetical protein
MYMYVYIFIFCVHIYVYMYIYIYIRICMHDIYTYLYMHVIYVCKHHHRSISVSPSGEISPTKSKPGHKSSVPGCIAVLSSGEITPIPGLQPGSKSSIPGSVGENESSSHSFHLPSLRPLENLKIETVSISPPTPRVGPVFLGVAGVSPGVNKASPFTATNLRSNFGVSIISPGANLGVKGVNFGVNLGINVMGTEISSVNKSTLTAVLMNDLQLAVSHLKIVLESNICLGNCCIHHLCFRGLV